MSKKDTHSPLLPRLTQRRRRPADNHAVDRVRADREDEARDVAARGVECRRRDHEADDRGRQARCDVPGALVEAA